MPRLFRSLVLALSGSILTWLGFACILGWAEQLLGVGILVIASGLLCIGFAGKLQLPHIPAAFGMSSAATLLAALLIGTQSPKMLNVRSEQDVTLLWVTMGAGTLLFFGLALLIGAGMAKLMAKD